MAKKEFRKPWDGVAIPMEIVGEVNNEPSQTVPGEAMTIQQIMDRAMAGTPPEQSDAQYFDVDDVSQVDEFFSTGLDLTDIDRLNARATELMGAIEEAKKRKKNEENNQNDSTTGDDGNDPSRTGEQSSGSEEPAGS